MHYHCETIMPPVKDVEIAVENILNPFNENVPESADYDPRDAFFDFYSIGGRFAGAKLGKLVGNDRRDF